MPDVHPLSDQVERAIDRAARTMEKLMDARMETIGAELRAIRERVDGLGGVGNDVEELKNRTYGLEAMNNSLQQRVGDLEQERQEGRRWWRDHFPSLLLSALGIAIALSALLLH